MKYFSSLVVLLLLVACSAPSVKTGTEQRAPVWPQPPLDAKIEWIGEYQVLAEAVRQKGFWSRVSEFFLGPKSAYLVRPYGVCTDNEDLLFVADAGGGKVHIFNMSQGDYSVIEATERASLTSPIGVVYVEGYVYITDSYHGRIFIYDLAEESLRPWSPFKFHRPTGIAYDSQAHLFYVSDTAAHEIVVLDRNGVEQFRIGRRGNRSGEFNFPTDIWFDDQSRQLYVTDSLNARIQILAGDGEFISQFGRHGDTPGSFSKPKGVASDRHGHVFVCDALFDAVQIFDQQGRILLSFGDNGARPGQFSMPSGIFIDKQSRIYVSDTYNRRIQVFREVESQY